MVDAESLLGRVVSSMAMGAGGSPSGRQQKSILSQAASAFARRPSGAESTIPTGFDPVAATLFEAVVEAAFLVATADGEFDETERNTFETVVHEACQNSIQRSEVHTLVSDLMDQLHEDGIDKRINMVSLIVHSDEHRHEVLRIAALMAQISGGVDRSERELMEKLAGKFGLSPQVVQQVLDQAATALGAR
jgi:tellurite resistance protein